MVKTVRQLLDKIKEALISALPITVIVYAMALTPWLPPSSALPCIRKRKW